VGVIKKTVEEKIEIMTHLEGKLNTRHMWVDEKSKKPGGTTLYD